MLTPRFFPLALLAVGVIALPACDSDDPGGGAGDEELITRVEITLTPVGGGDPLTLIARDEDGDGVGVEYSPRASLAAGATYTGSILLLDESNNVDVTDEIEGEADEHLFAYEATVPGVAVSITDSESDYLEDQGFEDYAVGLAFEVVVEDAASGSGTLGVVLYHFEGEDAKTSSTDTSDEIDVELAFPISVE